MDEHISVIKQIFFVESLYIMISNQLIGNMNNHHSVVNIRTLYKITISAGELTFPATPCNSPDLKE